MLARLASACFLALLVCGVAPTLAQQKQQGGVIYVPNEDPAMAAAKTKARATLAEFWAAFEKPGSGEDRFSLKVGFRTQGNDSEHIWVNEIARLQDGRYTGRLVNVPRQIPGVSAGSRVEFGDDQISDWMFMRNNKIVGNETLRPLLTRMAPAEAERYRAMLEKP